MLRFHQGEIEETVPSVPVMGFLGRQRSHPYRLGLVLTAEFQRGALETV
jgi:hypothetical protein